MLTKIMTAHRGILMTSTASFVAMLATTAFPESSVNAQDVMLFEEIVVTAQKREETLQEVPVAVSVVSGTALKDNFVDSIDLLASLAPSLTFSTSNSDKNASVRIRGIGTNTFSSTVEPSVSFVVDGVSLARQGQGFQDLIDIERVEVLRGPQSTLFGKNASAGVINVVTKKPSKEFTFDGELQYAELDDIQVKTSVSGPLSEKVAGRLSGFYKRRDGHTDNLSTGRSINGYENWGLRGKLLIEPSENLELLLIGEYRENKAECCQWTSRNFGDDINDVSYALSGPGIAYLSSIGSVVPGETNAQAFTSGDLFNDSKQWGVSLEANWDIGEYTLTSITAVKNWDFDNNTDIDGTSNALPITSTPSFDIGIGIPVSFVPQDNTFPVLDINGHQSTVTQYSQEVRLQSPIGEKFDYVVGLYGFYFDFDDSFDRRYGFVFPFEVAPGLYFGTPLFLSGTQSSRVNNRNIAAFGQANYHINDKLDLILGGRLLYERLEYDEFIDQQSVLVEGDTNLYASAPPLDTRNDPASTSDTATTVKAGLSYEVNDTLNTYFTYTSGYKGRASQTFSTLDFDPVTNLPVTNVVVNNVDPETSDAYELGFKYLSENKRFQVNLALFLTKYQGLQFQIFDPSTNTVLLANAGQAETKGIEADFIARPIDNLTLSGSFAYIKATVDELLGETCYPGQKISEGCDVNGGGDFGTQDLFGADLPNSPDLKFNIAARYDREVSSSGMRGFAQVSYNWQDDTQFVLGGSEDTVQESYGIMNASVGLTSADGKYTFTLYAKNLLDKQYATTLFYDFLVPGLINHYVPREAERYFGASLRVSF